MGGAHWLALGAVHCTVLAWARAAPPDRPAAGLLATYAVGPQWAFADAASPTVLAWAMPAQALLLVAVLGAKAAHYGLRLDGINWPLVAVLWLLCQSLSLPISTPRSPLWRCLAPR